MTSRKSSFPRTTPSRKSPKRSKKRWWWRPTTSDGVAATNGSARTHAARVAIGLGGNLDDPLTWFRIAARVFATLIDDLTAAPVYRTEPLSPIPQGPYLNTVLVGSTATAPADLLAVAKALERAAGRTPGARHGPRPLDVDLLLWGDLITYGEELRLPHPALRERRFVLQPLFDLEPQRPLPPDGRSVSEILAALPAEPRVERLGPWLVE